jgi:hypothetical protein
MQKGLLAAGFGLTPNANRTDSISLCQVWSLGLTDEPGRPDGVPPPRPPRSPPASPSSQALDCHQRTGGADVPKGLTVSPRHVFPHGHIRQVHACANDILHATAGIAERGGDDLQTAPSLAISIAGAGRGAIGRNRPGAGDRNHVPHPNRPAKTDRPLVR